MDALDRIVKHAVVGLDEPGPGRGRIVPVNGALEALRRLRKRRYASPAINRTKSFASLPRESEERELLLTAYGLRTLCLPEDLALLVQTYVERR